MNYPIKTYCKTAAQFCLLFSMLAWGPLACKQAPKEPPHGAGPEVAAEVGQAAPAPPSPPPAAAEPEEPAAPARSVTTAKTTTTAPAADAEDAPPPDDQPGLGVVLASKLNVRKSTTITPKNLAGSLRCGDMVNIQGKEGDWYQIALKDELQGYAHSSYIVRVRPGGRSPKCEFSFAHKPPAVAIKEDKPLPTTAQRSKDPAVIKEGAAAPEAGAPGTAAVSSAAPVVKPPAGAVPAARPVPSPPAPPVATAAAPVDKGPANIVLSGREDGAKPVKFPHQFHQKRYDCVKCHHPVATTNGGLSRVKVGDANANKKCRSCHVPEGSPQVRPTSKDIFHLACRDCHNVVGGGAPTGCPQCHK